MIRRLLQALPRRTPVALDDVSAVRFPETFLWGAATADHQVENSQLDDWSAFEADARSHRREQRVRMGAVVPGHIHGVAGVPLDVLRKKADFDARFAEDLAMAASLGHNAHRFSLSWARLFPREDQTAPEAAAIDFYGRVLDAHRQNGLTPFVTLLHFATPQWLWRPVDGKRGLERDDAIERFRAYVRAVASAFGGSVRHWCTLNEPMIHLWMGYREGIFPPNEHRKDPRTLLPVMRALLSMHAAAWHELKADARQRDVVIEVGHAQHARAVMPYTNGLLDRATTWVSERAFLWWFTDCIEKGALVVPGRRDDVIAGLRGSHDYIGINYYGRSYTRAGMRHLLAPETLLGDPDDADEEQSPMGWSVDAAGFITILEAAAQRYEKPIYVLENGIVDARHDDVQRQQYLERHVRALGRAMAERGVDARGYFHWSLLDNFEWAEGFEPRFGLIAVDYEHGFVRRPRASASLYARIIRAGGLPCD